MPFSSSEDFLSIEPRQNLWNWRGQSCIHMARLWLGLFQTACRLIALPFGLITTSFTADTFIKWGNALAYSFLCTGYICHWLLLEAIIHLWQLERGLWLHLRSSISLGSHCRMAALQEASSSSCSHAGRQGDRSSLLISINASDRTFTCLTFFLFFDLLLGRNIIRWKRALVLQLELGFYPGSAF